MEKEVVIEFLNISTDKNVPIDYNATEGIEPSNNNNMVDLAFKTVLCSILAFGLLGNLAFFLVVIRVLDMRTTINYYLANLAVVDCFTLTVGILLELRPDIYYHHCMLGAIFYFIPLYVSMFTIAIISMERYLVICHPLESYSADKKTRTLLQLMGVWLFALIFDVPQAVPCFFYDRDSGAYLIPNALLVASELSIIVSFSLVMLIASILNIRIIRVIGAPQIQPRGHHMSRYKRQVVKLLVTTSISFFVLLFPEMVFHLLLILLTQEGVITFYASNTAVAINFVARSLMFLNSAVNPIIYNISSQRYRKAFRATFTHWRSLTTRIKPPSSSRRGTLLTSVNSRRSSKKKVGSPSASPASTKSLRILPEKELLQFPNVGSPSVSPASTKSLRILPEKELLQFPNVFIKE